jgi:hypothetical protein
MTHGLIVCRWSHRDWYGSDVVDDNIGEDWSMQMRRQTTVSGTARLGWKTSHGEQREESRKVLPKNLIRPLPVQDHKSERFRRPALLFAGACKRLGWSRLRWHHSSEKRQKWSFDCVLLFFNLLLMAILYIQSHKGKMCTLPFASHRSQLVVQAKCKVASYAAQSCHTRLISIQVTD